MLDWMDIVLIELDRETNFIEFFHVSDHLEQFGRLLFLLFLLWKN